MIFTTISKKAATYGQSTPIGKDRFEQHGGVYLFFTMRFRCGKCLLHTDFYGWKK